LSLAGCCRRPCVARSSRRTSTSRTGTRLSAHWLAWTRRTMWRVSRASMPLTCEAILLRGILKHLNIRLLLRRLLAAALTLYIGTCTCPGSMPNHCIPEFYTEPLPFCDWRSHSRTMRLYVKYFLQVAAAVRCRDCVTPTRGAPLKFQHYCGALQVGEHNYLQGQVMHAYPHPSSRSLPSVHVPHLHVHPSYLYKTLLLSPNRSSPN